MANTITNIYTTHIFLGKNLQNLWKWLKTQKFYYRHYILHFFFLTQRNLNLTLYSTLTFHVHCTQTFLPSIWNLDTHPLEILSKKGRASLLIHSKDNSKVLPPFKTFNFSDIKNCVRLQVFLKIENALSKIDKLWKSMLFVNNIEYIEIFILQYKNILHFTKFEIEFLLSSPAVKKKTHNF